MQIKPFAIERFYERWEFRAEWMLSSSDCESSALGELLELEPDAGERLGALRLGYTEVAGSTELLAAVSGLYERLAPADVLTLAAAEEGIFTAYHALLEPGDHAIIEAPCYGSAIELAHSTGAAVSLWQRRYEDGWAHDLEALERLLRPETKLIYINSPHNPTGTQMPGAVFERLVELARERSIVVFGDEVYRGLEHDPTARLPAVCEAYERGISLGTVSSELLVALALRHAEHFVQRSRRLVLANLPLIDDLIARRPELLEWVRPTAGPIGFPRLLGVEDVASWCEQTAERASVLVLPGTVYEQPGHVRLGFGRANIAQALGRLDEHLG
jgi:aspartate/methionine/tyrosine aminotransferase